MTTSSNLKITGLSRLPVKIEKPIIYSSKQTIPLPVFAYTVQTATRKDPLLSKVLYFTKNWWPFAWWGLLGEPERAQPCALDIERGQYIYIYIYTHVYMNLSYVWFCEGPH